MSTLSVLPTRRCRRAAQSIVSDDEVQETDTPRRPLLCKVIDTEDSQPPPIISITPVYYTRARAAAEAKTSLASEAFSIGVFEPNKRKREQADDVAGAVTKKPATTGPAQNDTSVDTTRSNGSGTASRSASNAVASTCDDKDGRHIVIPDELLHKRYRTVRLVGRGTTSVVVEAVDTTTERLVAIKIIRAIPMYREGSRNEIRVLQELKKEDPANINKCIHLLESFDYRNHVCLMSELLGMSLYDFLRETDFAPFPPHHIQSFAKQLLGSVAFLHGMKCIHTDLRPEHILLVNNDQIKEVPVTPGRRTAPPQIKRIIKSAEIRLIDFGSATFEKDRHHTSSPITNRLYRAPEVILGLGWSFPCDAFSLGCILVEFFTGIALFQTQNDLEHLAMMEQVMGKMPEEFAQFAALSRPEYFEGGKLDWPQAKATRKSRDNVRACCSLQKMIPPTNIINQQFLNLVSKLLTFDPARRITVPEALRHPYFKLDIPEEQN